MVFGASAALTRLGFRRDVRLFLGALVGFLVALIMLLLLLLQTFLRIAEDAVVESWRSVADVVASELSAPEATDEASGIEDRASRLMGKYGIAGITFIRPEGRRLVFGVPSTAADVRTITRTVSGGNIEIVFEANRLRSIERTYWMTAIICVSAAVAGAFLLVLYLPRITRPIEEMLDSAHEIQDRAAHEDEQQFLIDTFRSSIVTLKAQEAELMRLHEMQKSRAAELERITAALTRSLNSGFIAIDPAGRIVDINVAAREILRPDGEAAGRDLIEALGENAFTAAVRDAVTNRTALSREEIELREGSSERHIGLTTVPLIGEEQQFLGLLALFTDLTPIRSLEVRVREMQALADLGEISGGIAHEFRNSLAAILGYLQLAKREPIAARPLASIENAEREASLLSAAVDSLLAFARPMRLASHEVNLRELVDDVVSRFGQTSSAKIVVEGDDVTIQGDAALLTRALKNLVRNALDSVAQNGGGTVRITLISSSSPSLRIEDDGIGVEPADVPRLLLPFQSDKPGGYGLGLPLAKKIVLLHGGTLTLTGARGRGAVVTIQFHPEGPHQSVRNRMTAVA